MPKMSPNGIEDADGPPDDLRPHGLEEEVDLLADERDLHVATPGKQSLRANGRVHPREPAAHRLHVQVPGAEAKDPVAEHVVLLPREHTMSSVS
jgi:hypothetical protein